MECARCHAPVADTAQKFCPQCGASLSDTASPRTVSISFAAPLWSWRTWIQRVAPGLAILTTFFAWIRLSASFLNGYFSPFRLGFPAWLWLIAALVAGTWPWITHPLSERAQRWSALFAAVSFGFSGAVILMMLAVAHVADRFTNHLTQFVGSSPVAAPVQVSVAPWLFLIVTGFWMFSFFPWRFLDRIPGHSVAKTPPTPS